MPMKRREFLKTAGAGVAASTVVAAPAIAQSMPEIKWRLTASWPKSLDTLWGGCEYFGKRIAVESADVRRRIAAHVQHEQQNENRSNGEAQGMLLQTIGARVTRRGCHSAMVPAARS